MVPLQIHIVVKGICATCLVVSNIIDQYTCILANNAQEKIWIQMWHTQNEKIFSVWAEIWTLISRMNDRRLSQLCHATAQIVSKCFSEKSELRERDDKWVPLRISIVLHFTIRCSNLSVSICNGELQHFKSYYVYWILYRTNWLDTRSSLIRCKFPSLDFLVLLYKEEIFKK
jgi:hypothetical protein